MLPIRKMLSQVLVFVGVMLSTPTVYAEDTEIYFVSGEGGGANVLVVIDTSAATHRNFPGTSFSGVQPPKTLDEIAYALKLVVNDLAGTTRIGISSQLSGGGEGGAVNYPVKQIDEGAAPVSIARVAISEGDMVQEVKVPSVPLATNDPTVSWGSVLTDEVLPFPSILSTGGLEYVLGVTLAELDVPRYAKIDGAVLTFKTPTAESGATESFSLRIAHEISSSPAPYTAASDFSGRDWNIGFNNGSTSYNAKGRLREGLLQIDVTSVIQDAVDDPFWCGNQNISLLIQGTSIPVSSAPEVYSFRAEDANNNRIGVPEVSVSWSATESVSRPAAASGKDVMSCMGKVVIGLNSANNDGVEGKGDENLKTDGLAVDLQNVTKGAQSERGDFVGGLRYGPIGFDPKTEVSRAVLSGVFTGVAGTGATLRIFPMVGDVAPFSAPGSIASAPVGTNYVDVPVALGTFDADVTALVNEMFSHGDWKNGAAMGFRLERKAGDQIALHALDDGSASAAHLELDIFANDPTEFVSVVSRRDEMKTAIDKFSDSKGGGNNKPVTAYVEAARYMLGKTPVWGASEGHAEAFLSDARSEYLSPLEQYDQCGGNHIILLTHADSNGESFKSSVDALTGNTNCDSSDAWQCSAEVAAFLQDAKENGLNVPITTHAIAFAPSQEEVWEGLQKVAAAGGGEAYRSEDAAELAKLLSKLIDRLTAEDASMAAPGVAVNQLNRFQHLDQLYYAVFKPALANRWEGNLKRYRIKFGSTASEAAIVDETGAPAVDPSTGFFKENSDSWWGTAPDGQNVALGGARQELANRKLLIATTTPAAGGSTTATSKPAGEALTVLDGVEDITDTALGMAAGSPPEEVQQRINFLLTGWGDPLHSEPRLVNYGYSGELSEAIANPDLQDNTVYVATNDGMLHAVDAETGAEVFTFMPAEELAKTEARFQNVSISGPDFKRNTYGLDGGIAVWRKSDGGSGVERVILYVGQRRGGNKYYALDVTDRSAPKILWRIDGGTGDYSNLGQTWSTPTVTQIMLGGQKVPVLVFGGGYSPAQHDTAGSVSSSDAAGNAIYIVNAFTGAVIWSASNSGGTETNSDMKWSIPAQVSVVDIDFDAVADYLYASDLGGQVFRVDLNHENTGASDLAFRVKTVAQVGTSESTGISNHRRFYAAPTLALIERDGKPMVQVIVGSGYRAHPLDKSTNDRIFAFDDSEALGALSADAAITPTIHTTDMLDVTLTDPVDASLLTGKRGWYINLAGDGEKVVSAAAVVGGKIYITSFLPEGTPVNACSRVIGTGRLYVLNAVDGSGAVDGKRVMDLNLPGLPPQAQVIVGRSNTENGLGDPTTIAIVGTAVGTSEGLEGSGIRRTRWYQVETKEEADQILEEAGATLP